MAAASGFTGNKGDIKLVTFYFFIHVLQVQIVTFCTSKEEVPVNFRKYIANGIIPPLLSQLKKLLCNILSISLKNRMLHLVTKTLH